MAGRRSSCGSGSAAHLATPWMVVVDSPGSPAESPTKLRSLLASFDLGRAVQWALLLIRMGRWPFRSRPNMPLAERAQSLKRGDSRAHAARSTSFAGLSLLRRRGAPRVIVVRRRRGAVDKTSAHDTSTAESAVTLAANHRCPLRLSPSPDPVTSTAKSARRSTPTPTPTAASAAWDCAGGRPSPPRLPSIPSPAAPPGSRRPAARLRSAVCAAGDSTRRPVWLGPRLPRAVKRWPAAAPLVASHRTAATAAGARQATARSRAGANAP
ncbi:hypothetical protein PAHAL_9G453900 [Panicum hallii]|uniref:Uncharacterized protein n=1 Tax=Panicum hallii TaxID=206008 RepID=A0A2T8I4S4_9POAL|nr:hypothetical protein PAHAL_9G453900 [Panicum hallii]